MRPKRMLYDYEYFQSAFDDMLAGMKEIIKQKLWYLSQRRWKFRGWVTYPDYHKIRFELAYDDDKTEESYRISGYCDISMRFAIKEASFDFEIADERTQKYVNFKTTVDEKESLADIEPILNELLKNNRSYRYFCEDYERYVKQDPIQYIKDLLSDHLIDIEEEIIEEEFGFIYRYTGEFGEDYLEIVINDQDVFEGNEEDVFDCIDVNVADRFHFSFLEEYSKKIRALQPLLRPSAIPVNDFLIRTNSKYCVNKDHHLHRIKALVCVDDGNKIKETETDAMFCAECSQYFISELAYKELCKQGKICSRVITIEEYKKINESGFHAWADRSLLRSYGYTVNAQDNLSDDERQRILSFVIENKIMKVDEIIFFIEWLINRNSGKDFYNARLKWNRDIGFLRNYKPVEGIVRVRDIYKKRYI